VVAGRCGARRRQGALKRGGGLVMPTGLCRRDRRLFALGLLPSCGRHCKRSGVTTGHPRVLHFPLPREYYYSSGEPARARPRQGAVVLSWVAAGPRGLPSPFSLPPSPFSLPPSPFSLPPSPLSLPPSPFSLPPSPFSLLPASGLWLPFPARAAPVACRLSWPVHRLHRSFAISSIIQ
jgi:hypothetical protein